MASGQCAVGGLAPAAANDDDIYYSHLRCEEMKACQRPSPDYLWEVQRGKIDAEERASLVAWMDEMTRHYELAAGTLHRAVSYVDRYLSVTPLEAVSARQLSLLAATAVLVAAKYEDSSTAWRLEAGVIARDSGELYYKIEVVQSERALLAALGYMLGCPTARTFADHFVAVHGDSQDSEVASLSRHLADLTLLDDRSLKFPPSVVGASAVLLARYTLMVWPWDESPGYSFADLRECLEHMYEVHETRGFGWAGYKAMEARYPMEYTLPPRRSRARGTLELCVY